MCPLTPGRIMEAQSCPSDGLQQDHEISRTQEDREAEQCFSEIMLLWTSRVEATHLCAGLWEFSEWHKWEVRGSVSLSCPLLPALGALGVYLESWFS